MSAVSSISGVVIARDEADRIARCVRSLAAVCAEVIVLDSGSTDDTVAIARAAGATVEHQPWLGFAAQKNAAIARARHDWVLLLDADEWLEPPAQRVIRAHVDEGGLTAADVFVLPRRTHFLGGRLRFGGRGREPVERLFRRELRYAPAAVHEALDLRGRKLRALQAVIEHDTARDLASYVAKLDDYARLWAQQRAASGRRVGALAAPLHAAAYWIKNALLRGGVLDGRAGWRYHAAHARYVHRKYALLRAATGA